MDYKEILVWVILVAVFVFVFLRIVEIIDRRTVVVDAKSKFLVDMYKLQQKWAKKGKQDYAEAIGMLIKAFNLPPEEKQAQTQYGKEVIEGLKKLQDEEV